MASNRSKPESSQTSYIIERETKALAVPAIRSALAEWRDGNYRGATDTSRILLNYWFETDHILTKGQQFQYFSAQREAIESLIYVYEVARTRGRYELYRRFIPREKFAYITIPTYDDFARYSVKMATGSGKTKVMALAIAWQYFNAVLEDREDYAKTFLVIAPNVIVFERLRGDFAGGVIFQQDPVIPSEFQQDWQMQFYMRGEPERASAHGAVYLTNIQQLYERADRRKQDEPEIMTAMLGEKPASTLDKEVDFRERIIERTGTPLLILNDEAHHTHAVNLKWNEIIRDLHMRHSKGLSAQLDFSATPRDPNGALFPWVISDYPLGV